MSKLRVDKIAAPIVQDEFTGSVHFDGTDWLIIASSSDFAFGTGDFTIELWAYHTNLTGQQTYFGDTSGATAGIYTYKTTDNAISLYDTAQRSVSSNNVIKLNTWHHIAWTRESGVLRAFLDGVKVDEDTYTGDFTITQYYIGSAGVASEQMLGYISNLRVCKGHAVYTGNFTVPTRELPVHTEPPKGVVFPAADNRTVLLACQSSTDATLDSSGRHTITVNGDPTAADANPGLFRRTLNLTTVTENTGSVFFDGTDDYLIAPSSNDFSFAGDFTIEFWVNTSTFSVDSFFRRIVSNGADAATSIQLLFYDGSGATSNLSVYSNAMLITGDIAVATGDWVHVALSRSGTSMKLFVNGAQSGSTATTSQNFSGGATNGLIIGKYAGGNSGRLNGYLSNLRICKGHAVYKSQFIPPTRELEVHQGPDDDRTVLLACYDGENIFADKSGRHTIAAYGDRLSSPTPTATDSPIGITTHNPGLTRNVDPVDGPTFQGGAGFTSQNWLTLPKGTTTDRNPKLSNAVSHGSARAIFGAIQVYPTAGDSIHYATIATFGNTVDFGDLSVARRYAAGCSSKTRGLFAGGSGTVPADKMNTIEYITIASTGDAKDFGDLITARWGLSAFSNSTRGIFFSGNTSPANTNVIEYVTISTLGNALDFGDAFSTYRYVGGSTSDTTRGISAGGYSDSARVNTIQYVTMASTGNAQDFGDLLAVVQGGCGGVSNGTRGVFAGGYTPTQVNTIEYITIQSMGNSNDFGDMTSTDARNGSSAESSIRGLFQHGGYPGRLNTIDAITIATTGNAVEFGDIIDIGGNDGGGDSGTQCGFSNGHGGLG